MVSITNGELLDAFAALRELASTKLPPRLAIRIARATRELQPAVGDIESVRNDLVEEYAERDEGGQIVMTSQGVKLKAGAQEAWAVTWGQLAGVTLNVQSVIPESAFLDAPELEPNLFLALGPLLVE